MTVLLKMPNKLWLDLVGTACPMNFVRIKIALEKLAPGSRLQVRLDGGAVAAEVTRSLLDQGYRVSRIKEKNGIAELTVYKYQSS